MKVKKKILIIIFYLHNLWLKSIIMTDEKTKRTEKWKKGKSYVECKGYMNNTGPVSCPLSREEFVGPSKTTKWRCKICKKKKGIFHVLCDYDCMFPPDFIDKYGCDLYEEDIISMWKEISSETSVNNT